jgi:GTP-binding protein Era
MAREGFRSGMIALVGETNAGKSTLLNALLGAKVSIVASKPHTTRNRILGIKTLPDSQIVLVDTPGFVVRGREKSEMGKFTSRVLQEAASGVDLVLLVVDVLRLEKNPSRIEELVSNLRDRRLGVPAIVAMNKVDAIRKDKLLPMMQLLDAKFSGGPDPVELVPISAATGDGLDVLERIIHEKLPEGEALFPDDIVSDQPEPFLASEIIREKMLHVLEEEVPHSAAVQIEDWEDTDGLLSIQALIMVEKDSQKAIVIGKGGRQIKEIGQLAREELEQLFGVKVFLKLFVKVEADWTKTEKGLARAGYNY